MDIAVNADRRQMRPPTVFVLLLVALSACSTTHAEQPVHLELVEASSVPLDPKRQPATLPTELLGVWSKDDPYGRAQCDRYRTLPEDIGESDEGWISLIGSLVITPSLIHAFSEYGEGDFHVVKEIESEGHGLWAVNVQVGIDYMPTDDTQLEVDTYRMRLQQGRLNWGPVEAGDEDTPALFRCDSVRKDVYQIAHYSAQENSLPGYPDQVLGRWEPGPGPCRLPLDYDSTAGFEVRPQLLQGYEHTNTPKAVQLLSSSPPAWRIESIEEHDGVEDKVTDIFVVDNDHLTVTDGRNTNTYRRCHPKNGAVSRSAEFPKELLGQWMLGPEPCFLPMNADADGQLTITREKMYGYEDTYDPVGVSTNSDVTNSWSIAIAEQLGDQRHVSNSVFTLRGSALSIKYDEEYTATYVKCMEKHDD